SRTTTNPTVMRKLAALVVAMAEHRTSDFRIDGLGRRNPCASAVYVGLQAGDSGNVPSRMI
ncbi:MAG: hypothetical protein RKL32_03230, partial [Gammaproteobacteria bacterium]